MTRLLAPSLDLLDGYAAALRAGWSPDNSRDVTGEELAAIANDAPKHLSILRGRTPGIIRLPGGREVERLPGFTRWIGDDAFCGTINVRHQPGTEELPAHVSGHVGYAIVPWKRRQGHSTRALWLLLPLARALGLPRLLLTCDADNEPSRGVIEANGGTFAGSVPNAERPEVAKLLFWVATG
ncbi:MAG TPA: GNAT family N-acetyltransferase [Acetobacteraceae bacterium]